MMATSSLIDAVQRGTLLEVEEAIARLPPSVTCECPDSIGRRALVQACSHGHLPLVRVLLRRGGAHVHTADGVGMTPLCAAAANGHHQIVKFLLRSGADVNQRAMWQRNELLYELGQIDDPNIAASAGQTSALFLSVCCGQFKCAQVLLHAKADPNLPDKTGATPLLEASFRGDEKLVELLLDNGAEVCSINRHRETALHWAVEEGHHTVVALLLKHSAPPLCCDRMGMSPFHKAVCVGNIGIVEEFLHRSAVVRECSNCFAFVSPSTSTAILQALINEGCDPNASTPPQHDTVLHIISRWTAHEKQSAVLLRCIIAHGGDVEKENLLGRLPLHEAAIAGNVSAVECLLSSYCADEEGRDSCERINDRSIQYKRGNNLTMQESIPFLSPINTVDRSGNTPFLLAASFAPLSRAVECVKVLLQCGSDPTVKNFDGLSVLDLVEMTRIVDNNGNDGDDGCEHQALHSVGELLVLLSNAINEWFIGSDIP